MPDALLDLRRAGTLLWVATKYGLAPRLRNGRRDTNDAGGAAAASDGGVRLRLALESLGLTYLKFGQYLAMRQDLVAADVARELQKLFERVTPASFEEVRAVVEAELGGPLEQFYREFRPEPIAAASVAQVHAAQLLDGRRVAVKVQRPDVRRIFFADIRNLRRFAALVDATGVTGTVSLSDLVEEFAVWTERELDFRLEAATADRLRAGALPFEHAPLVYWELTATRVLTMDLIEGISLAELAQIFESGGAPAIQARLPGLDLHLALKHFAMASLHQIFERRFFHGDPHPGNLLIRADHSIVFVDFGIFGELTPYEAGYLRRFIEAVATGNVAAAVRHYMKQLTPTPETDQRAFRHASIQIFRRWYEASRNAERSTVADRRLGRYSGEIIEQVRRYHLRMGMNTMLFWRAMDALDSSALRFPGYLDLLSTMREFFEPKPSHVIKQVGDMGLDPERAVTLAGLARESPGQAMKTLSALTERRREWSVGWEESGAEFRAENRRSSALAAGLVGLSLLVLGLTAPIDVAVRAAALGVASLLALWTVAQVRD